MDHSTYKVMIEALKAGTATPDQQRDVVAYIDRMRLQHTLDLREAERDSRDYYYEGRANAAADARGEPYGTY